MKGLSKKSVVIIITVAVVAVIIIAVSVIDAVYQKRNMPFTHTGIAMGSVVSQKIYGNNICADVFNEISVLDADKLSTTSVNSEISEINKNAGKSAVEVSDETVNYLKACIALANDTNGAFNPLMGALIDLWDIESENPRIPTAQEIEQTLLLCDYTQIELDGNRVYLPKEGMKLHLGAAGKGIACDTAYKVITAAEHVRGAVVSVGGSVMTLGKSTEDEGWTIGIRDPKGNISDMLGTLTVFSEKYISTSGSYEKYFEQDGERYHHIFDYSTGAPTQSELISVTVVAPSGMFSDALSTACFVLGAENSREILSQYDSQAIFVYENGDIIITEGISDSFELRNGSYRIAQVMAL